MSRRMLAPLAPVYGAMVDLKNMAYDFQRLHPKRLGWPVVSIGNLSVGGSGKTPLVIALAERLKARGIAVDVLSRGFGRASKSTERVDPQGEAGRYGDEPLLIARQAGVPVYVGSARFEAGMLAESGSTGPGVHLLDDGFQHRKLARSVDIVVLHRSDFESRLLPAGRLREPVYALRRAHIVVVRRGDEELLELLRWHHVQAAIWRVKRQMEAPSDIRKVAAFCGIAWPQEFFAGLEQCGLTLVKKTAFRDHQRWSDKTLQALVNDAGASGAGAFVTTEKDAVRLSAPQRMYLENVLPLHTARLSVILEDEEAAIDQLLTMLRR